MSLDIPFYRTSPPSLNITREKSGRGTSSTRHLKMTARYAAPSGTTRRGLALREKVQHI